MTDAPIQSGPLDGIETDTMRLILSAADASGLAVRFEVEPSPKGDSWVQVAPAFELARLIKQGRETEPFVDHIGGDRLRAVEVLLGPYMDMA